MEKYTLNAYIAMEKYTLNAYIAMEKYTLNAYIIFFKNTPFYAFLGLFSTKLPLLTRFACINACMNTDKQN